jgi:hypothetical protein
MEKNHFIVHIKFHKSNDVYVTTLCICSHIIKKKLNEVPIYALLDATNQTSDHI